LWLVNIAAVVMREKSDIGLSNQLYLRWLIGITKGNSAEELKRQLGAGSTVVQPNKFNRAHHFKIIL
jgi:hypothetical protein